MRLTWLGHAAFHLETDTASVLIDPFWTGNPTFPQGYEDRLAGVDAIALTHGHEDHIGDTARLAQKYAATVIGQPEILAWLGGQGVDKVEPVNIGGSVEVAGMRFTLVQAFHSSAMVVDGRPVTMGDPAGLHDQGRGYGDLPCRRHRSLRRHGAAATSLPADDRTPAGG